MNKSDLYSTPALATYAGLGVSIYSAVNDKLWAAVLGIALGLLVMIGTSMNREKRVRELKSEVESKNRKLKELSDILKQLEKQSDGRRKKVFSNWHKVSHSVRDFTTQIVVLGRGASTDTLAQELKLQIEALLNVSSTIFSELTGHDCIASLMVYDETNQLSTRFYSSNAPPDRSGNQSSPISTTRGIVGSAFAEGDATRWTLGDLRFIPIRKNYENYYRSGLTIPFKVGRRYAGVLNIDSLIERNFENCTLREAGCAVADAIGIVMGILDLYTKLNRPSTDVDQTKQIDNHEIKAP
ncbi:MAG: hypothetical protein RLZZ179_628 [Verrucomicrobiota bacterium]|jgi:hypothetical protein